MNMKRFTAFIMALALLFIGAGAENASWLDRYNALAAEKGAKQFSEAELVYDAGLDCYVAEMEGATCFAVKYSQSGNAEYFLMQAEVGNEILVNMLSCAMTATGYANYAGAQAFLTQLTTDLPDDTKQRTGYAESWMYMAYKYEYNGKDIAMVGLWLDTNVATYFEDESTQPQEAEESEPTVAPQETEYKDGKRIFKA